MGHCSWRKSSDVCLTSTTGHLPFLFLFQEPKILTPATTTTTMQPPTVKQMIRPTLTISTLNASDPAFVEARRLRHPIDHYVLLTPSGNGPITWIGKLKANFSYGVYRRSDDCLDSIRNIQPNFGREASAYIRFILDNYDNHLPNYTAFLHGHQNSWHSESMPQILEGLQWGKAPFMNLNFHHRSTRWPNLFHSVYVPDYLPDWWDYLFGDVLKKEPILSYCCAQFVVSKERILAVPKHLWQRWYDWLIAEKVPSGKSSRIFEFSWPAILGEPYDAPPYPGGMCHVSRCSLSNQVMTTRIDYSSCKLTGVSPEKKKAEWRC